MTNPLKRFVDYVIDRGGDRVAERMFDRYGDDVTAFITNATNMFTQPIGPSTPPSEPHNPGLRSV
jgi:hypothetical protein